MQRVLLLLTDFMLIPKRGKVLLSMLLLLLGGFANAQSNGIYESYAILSINGGANAYYDMQAATGNPDLEGLNLGTFTLGTNSLIVKGGQNKTYKCDGGDVSNGHLRWRVWRTSAGASGAFNSETMSWVSNDGGGCGGNQTWEGTGGLTNIVNGRVPGNYTLEVYSDADGIPGTVFSSNGANNYKAAFTVVANPALPVLVSSTTGVTALTGYATLKAAFDAVNAGTHTGVITMYVGGNTTETAIASLNASGLGSASYTSINITPVGGAARTITGSMATEMILLNGADNVTIDGLNAGGNSLTISNTSTSAVSGTSTIKFIGGAISNTITNCSVLGSSTMPVGTNGGNVFFSTDSVTVNGNDNNTISNCNIGPAGLNLPTKGIYGNGSTSTTAIGNSGIVINNNNIFDFFGAAVTSAGIYIPGGCNTWSITNNRFYQTGTRTWTTAAQHSPIWITSTIATSGAQGFTITGNTIGYASNTQTGTYTLTGSGTSARFWGIHFNGIPTGTATTISNNTIAGINMSGVTGAGTGTANPFSAIFFNEGVGITNNNIIGSQSATGSLVFSTTTASVTEMHGIFNYSSSTWTSNGNTIGGLSMTNLSPSASSLIYGLRAFTGTSVLWTANNNTIGGNVPNSIQLNTTGASSQVIGMFTINAPNSLTGNTVRNLTTNSGTGTTTMASVIGIGISSAANGTISQNSIYNLSNTSASGASVVTGLHFNGGAANTVDRNFIYGLTAATTSATAEINGIRVAGGTTTYKNNMIAVGTGIANAIQVNGINEPSATGTDNFLNNSIYIGGTPVAGTANSFAFNSAVTTSTRSFRNNIFVNARSNNGATGKNYAVRVGGTTVNPAGLTINNNIYSATGSGAVFGFFNSLDVADLTAWKAAVGQDANSFAGDPQFINPAASTPDLHINASIATIAEGTGAVIATVTDDFDGQTRSALTPTDIGADAGNFTAAPSMALVSSTTGQLTGSTCSGASNVPVIRMEVVTTGVVNPLTLANLTINGNGTSNLGDVATYRIYYTGTSSTFAASNPVNAATAGLSASDTVITPTGTVTLSEGTNYFWLVYNLNPLVAGPNLDGEFKNITLSTGAGTPTITAPAGIFNVFQTPTATAGSNSPVCAGGTLNLSAMTDIGTGFSWTGPNGFVSSLQNPSIPNVTAANAGTYNLTANVNGCTSILSSVVVVVNPTPVAPTTTGASICVGGTFPPGGGLTSTIVGGASVTGSQVINFNVSAQPTETTSAPGNIVASATMSGLPAGAVVTSVVISYNGLTALGSSWRADIKLGLSGALVNSAASDPAALNSAGSLNYMRTATSGITATNAGGTVNLLYWDATSDNSGSEATFPTGPSVASVTVNYSYPNPNAVSWYDAASGGTLIGTGTPFNPIGTDPALPNSNTPGTHNYFAAVSNGLCQSTRTLAVLQIGSALTTGAGASPSAPICNGLSATLTATPSGGGAPYTYSWKIGTTEVSALSSFSVSPSVTTTYDLTVTDACSQTATNAVTVNVNPSLAVVSGPSAICAPGSSVTLTETGGTATSWLWSTGATTQSITVNPSVTTVYTVTTTSPGSCQAVAKHVIDINPLPGTPTLGSNSPVCEGNAVNLTATAIAGGYSISSNSGVAFVDINATGVSVGTIADDSEHNITIPSFTFNGVAYTAARVGTNGILAFGATTGDIAALNAPLPSTTNSVGNVFLAPYWDDLDMNMGGTIKTQTVGNVFIVQFTGLDHNLFTTGNITFQIQLNLSTGVIHYVYPDVVFGNATYDAAVSATVGMQFSNTSSLQYSYNSATLFNGESISFTPFTPTYSWTGPNGFSSDLRNPTIASATAAASGTYTLVVSNPNTGCQRVVTQNVVVNVAPVGGTVSGSTSVCTGSVSGLLTLSGHSGTIIRWESSVSPFTTWTPIANTTTTYLSGVLTQTTEFRAVIGSGICANVFSAPAIITIASTTWTSGSWSNGVPNATTAAIIASNYTSATNLTGDVLTACSLTVNNNAVVVVSSGDDFNIAGAVTVSPGSTLTFANNANLLQDPAGTTNSNSGSITSTRETLIRRLDYTYWSSPVAGQDLKLFSPYTVSPTNAPGVTTPVGTSRFYTLNEPTNAFAVIAEPLGVGFEAAKGYMLRAPNNFPANGTPTVFTGQFKGVPNNGNYSVAITNTAVTGAGFNMLGNPYPSAMDATEFLETNPGTLYFWSPKQVGYSTYNTFGVTPIGSEFTPNGIIQTGQGFLLHAENGGTANFTNAMRSGNNQGQFFRGANVEKHRFWLHLSNAGTPVVNQILVGYMAGATEGFDVSVDGLLNHAGSSISSMIGAKGYAIQGRSLPFNVADVVPLAFNAATEGSYTLTLDQLDGLFAGDQDIFLKDNLTGAEQNLKAGAYTFASTAGSFSDRFSIVYQTTLGVENPTFDANTIVVYKDNGVLHINSGTTRMSSVKVFDIRGRLIYEKSGINATTTSLNDMRAEQQVLLVQITSDENRMVTKKVIN